MAFGSKQNSGPPAWFVFIMSIALIFALYYLWMGLRDFLQTGGLGITEATEQAVVIASATAERLEQSRQELPTLRPTLTPIPECQDFIVTAHNAIVREHPTTNSAILTSFFENSIVCVVGREGDSEWYIIDSNPDTRRINIAYMHESVIRALNPTPTPTDALPPAPSITPTSSFTPSVTPSPHPTSTHDPNATDTLTPTLTPTPTAPMVST